MELQKLEIALSAVVTALEIHAELTGIVGDQEPFYLNGDEEAKQKLSSAKARMIVESAQYEDIRGVLAYESYNEFHVNYKVALESSDNIFKAAWKWLVRVWKSIFGGNGNDGSNAKAAIKRRKSAKKELEKALSDLSKVKNKAKGLDDEFLSSKIRDMVGGEMIVSGDFSTDLMMSYVLDYGTLLNATTPFKFEVIDQFDGGGHAKGLSIEDKEVELEISGTKHKANEIALISNDPTGRHYMLTKINKEEDTITVSIEKDRAPDGKVKALDFKSKNLSVDNIEAAARLFKDTKFNSDDDVTSMIQYIAGSIESLKDSGKSNGSDKVKRYKSLVKPLAAAQKAIINSSAICVEKITDVVIATTKHLEMTEVTESSKETPDVYNPKF